MGFSYPKTGLNANTQQGLSAFTPIAQELPGKFKYGVCDLKSLPSRTMFEFFFNSQKETLRWQISQ